MSNIERYAGLTAFHPGYYVAEILEEMGVTQEEFAIRLDSTGKTVSKLINGQINISKDLAKKLSTMLGTSVQFWLNLQSSYEEKMIEIEKQKDIDKQMSIISMIDYSYFVKVAHLPETTNKVEKVENLCRYFMVSNLNVLKQPDFLANFRTSVSMVAEKNIINSQAWLQTAMNYAKTIETQPFNSQMLKTYIDVIRGMTIQQPDIFLPRLKYIFSQCGVAFVLLPHLKNSGINGAVKWISPNRVLLAINDRRTYADTFWFSLFHEIKHVFQQKTKKVFLSMDGAMMNEFNDRLEMEADSYARDILIPPEEYHNFASTVTKYISDEQIITFAEKIGIHPGIVAGRLQHDGLIQQNRCSRLKQQYKIII